MKSLSDIVLLYVEDSYNAQETLKLILEDEIKELYQAYNGQEALEIYKKERIDIVITDLHMPDIDGFNFAKIIKKINYKQPIIIISGFDMKQESIKFKNIKINHFLSKPLNIDVLLQKLEQIIQQSK